MLYTEVFLNKFLTGDNAAAYRQLLSLSESEVNFMIEEISGSNSVKMDLVNDDASSSSFEVKLTAPTCDAFQALRFLFHGVNTAGYTPSVIPVVPPVDDVDKLDTEIRIAFTPVV